MDNDLFGFPGDETEPDPTSIAQRKVFPILPGFEQDESLLGLLASTGVVNGRDKLSTLVRSVGLRTRVTSLPFSRFEIQPIADMLGVAPQEIDRRLYARISVKSEKVHWVRFFHETVPRRSISTVKRRFSPAAWNLQPYHRAIWDIKAIPCCLSTGQILIDRCPCGSPLIWRPTRLTLCGSPTCRFDLSAAEAPFADPEVVSKLQFFGDLFSADEKLCIRARSRLPSELSQISGAEILQLSIMFGMIATAEIGRLPSYSRRTAFAGYFTEWSEEALAYGLDVVLGWPTSFYEVADYCRVHQSTDRTGHGFTKHLGRLETYLGQAILPQRIRKIFFSALGGYFDQHPKLRLSRHNREGIRTSIKGTINLNAAVRRYKISKHSLLQLREFPQILAYDGRIGVEVLFHAVRLAEVIEKHRDTITGNAAAQLYGVPRLALQRLAEKGLINFVDGPEKVLRSDALEAFRRSSIEGLLAKIDRQVVPTDNGVSLQKAVAWSLVDDPWVATLTGLAEGKLSLLGVDKSQVNIGDRYRVDKEQVRRFLWENACQEEDFLPVTGAATLLRIEAACLRELLQHLGIRTMGCPAMLATSDFKRIAGSYISGPEVSERLGLSARAAWNVVAEAGLQPVVRLRGERVPLLYRSEFEALVPRIIAAMPMRPV